MLNCARTCMTISIIAAPIPEKALLAISPTPANVAIPKVTPSKYVLIYSRCNKKSLGFFDVNENSKHAEIPAFRGTPSDSIIGILNYNSA